jgi:hypothetical protein
MTPAGGAMAGIESLPLAVAMRQWLWLYPGVEIVHIVGFVTLVGSILVFDLRVLGLTKSISIRALARHTLPWTLGALLLVVPTGLMMFTAHATDFISNRAFVLKMTLLMAAASNAMWFHLGPYRSVALWDTTVPAPAAAKLSTLLSILIWLSVISCGRLLAYL